MKKNTLIKVLALVLVLVMCVGIFAACGKKDNKPDEPKPTPVPDTKPKTSTLAERQDTFLNMLFDSANELADGVTVSTEDGNDISFNIGATIKVRVGSNKLPVKISAKAFLDRTNIEKSNPQFNIHSSMAKLFAEEVNDGQGWVQYDANKVYSVNAQYRGTWYYIADNNETVIDASINIANVESFGIYYDAKVSKNIIYLTVGGNKYDVDLSQLINSLNTSTDKYVESTVYNLFEKVVKSPLFNTFVNALNGENGFDLNKICSDAINELLQGTLKGRSLYQFIKDELGLKPGQDGIDISKIIFGLFGGEEEAKKNLGNNIDMLGLLKSVKEMTLSDPSWKYYENGQLKTISKKDTEFVSKIKSNLQQKLVGSVDLQVNAIGQNILDMTIFKGGRIRLGFVKNEGSGNKLGALDEFSIELFINDIIDSNGQKKDFGIELIVDDLKISNQKDGAIVKNETQLQEYGAFNFDAGIDLNINKDALKLIFGNDKVDYTVNFGTKEFSIVGNVINIPEKANLRIYGALDLNTSENTQILAELSYMGEAGKVVVAKAQIYGKEGIEQGTYSLVVEAKVEDKALLNGIMEILKSLSDGRSIGKNGFAYDKVLGIWGFWQGPGTGEGASYARQYKADAKYSYKGISEELNKFFNTGEIKVDGLNVYTLVETVVKNLGTIFVCHTTPSDADVAKPAEAAKIDTMSWIMGALLSSDRDAGAVTMLANILNYYDGNFTIGGEDAFNKIFDNVLYYLDPEATPDIYPSIYSMLGYFVSASKATAQNPNTAITDIKAAYEYMERRMYDLNAGYNLPGSSGTIRLEAAGQNSIDKLLKDRNIAELEKMGYTVVATDKTGVGAVIYPTALFNFVMTKANNEVAKTTPATELGDGFMLVEVPQNLTNVSAQNLYNRATQKYYQVISKPIEELVKEYKANPTYDIAKLIMRRGTVVKMVNGEVEQKPIFMDEAMLGNADLSVSIYTEKSDKKITKGGIKIEANYDGAPLSIDLYMNFTKKEVAIDKNLVSEGCANITFDIVQ